MSKLKAELVRNNIVTRANLIKLYQPPKVHKMPTPNQNPFYNGEIVHQSQASAQESQQSTVFLDHEGKYSTGGGASLYQNQGSGSKMVNTRSDGVGPFTVGKGIRRSSH